MAQSMTGYCRCTAEIPRGRLVLEAFSVNSRYLEPQCQAPGWVTGFEPRVLRALRAALGRGKVTVRLFIESRPGLDQPWDESRLTSAYRYLGDLASRIGAPVPALEALLPYVGFQGGWEDTLDQVLDDLLSRVLEGLKADRAREGAALVAAMTQTAQAYGELTGRIKEQWVRGRQAAFDAWKERIQATVRDLGEQPDPSALATQLVIACDKWDITEELTRTAAHLEHFFALLRTDGPVGRKLDFMLQELNREMNTLGSKINDQEVRWLVVEAKSLLENLREQAQNVE